MKNYPEPSKDDIEKVRTILKRRNIGFLLMLLGVPIIAIIGETTKSEIITAIFGFLYMIFLGKQLLQAAFSLCPRCKNNFFTQKHIANGFTSKCMHCGLSGRMPKKFRNN